MDSFNQDFCIPHSEENRNMNSNHDDHNDSVMQNAAVKQDGTYQPSEHDDKYSKAESCGLSQPAQPDASGNDWAGKFLIIDSGKSLSNTQSASSTSISQQALIERNPMELWLKLFHLRTELRKSYPESEILELAQGVSDLEYVLDLKNKDYMLPMSWI